MYQPKIIVHGGAWAIPDELREEVLKGVRHAVQAGFQILKQGKGSLDAVEIAVRILEDNPFFDAGENHSLNHYSHSICIKVYAYVHFYLCSFF
jgi:beta-aspartyl-peptidase (threonine type)